MEQSTQKRMQISNELLDNMLSPFVISPLLVFGHRKSTGERRKPVLFTLAIVSYAFVKSF